MGVAEAAVRTYEYLVGQTDLLLQRVDVLREDSPEDATLRPVVSSPRGVMEELQKVMLCGVHVRGHAPQTGFAAM